MRCVAVYIILLLLAGASSVLALSRTDEVKLNELYFAGSPGLGEDGFIELYNAGADTAYLDGSLLIQGLDTLGQLAYRFYGEPGGRELPLAPGEFLIFAIDAFNFMEEYPASVNLSAADYESAQPFETPPGDNPEVPNLTDVLEIGFDWFFPPAWGQILLATGEEWQIWPCEPGQTCGNIACVVPLETIVDGVEYLYETGEQQPVLRDDVDLGVITGIPPRSGWSAERRSPGWDTNDSSTDFVSLERPTPGLAHSLEAPERRASAAATGIELSAYPNPFNTETRITFNLERDGLVQLSVLNVLGQPVRTLMQEYLTAGRYDTFWDGTANGQNLTSGIYFIRLTVQHEQAVMRLALTR